jgi:N6-adenosine-specific RNA methylase IME4
MAARRLIVHGTPSLAEWTRAGRELARTERSARHYVSVRHEHLLICTRGSCTPDRPTPMPASVQTIRGQRHGEKPPEFRTLIDRLYPFGRRVELFARGSCRRRGLRGGIRSLGRSLDRSEELEQHARE